MNRVECRSEFRVRSVRRESSMLREREEREKMLLLVRTEHPIAAPENVPS